MAPRLLNRNTRYILYKFWALLGLVRWYNIMVMALALYLSAIYLFNPGQAIKVTLMDFRLHLEVLALCLFIASGYIINAFYDIEKDMINRPHQTFFDRHISKEFSLTCYFLFNTLAGILSIFVDYRVFVVNVLFSLVLWGYSHKMRKMRFIGEVGAAMLTVAPFFSLTFYYQDVTMKMVEFVGLIFVFIIAREVCKKLIAIRGDIILGNQSIPILFGEKRAAYLVSTLALVSIAQIGFFIRFILHGEIEAIFYFMAFILLLIAYFSSVRKNHSLVNNLYKVLLLACILSIPFI